MRIRCKHGYQHTHDVIEESPSFYIVKHDGVHVMLRKDTYEPVPTERWVDVTGECDLESSPTGYTIYHLGMRLNWDKYRVLKVDSCRFAVERKEST